MFLNRMTGIPLCSITHSLCPLGRGPGCPGPQTGACALSSTFTTLEIPAWNSRKLSQMVRSSCGRKSEYLTSQSEVSGGTSPEVGIPTRKVRRTSPTQSTPEHGRLGCDVIPSSDFRGKSNVPIRAFRSELGMTSHPD